MHPLAGCDPDSLSIVLNGIVENYRELKESLGADGHTFTSETDAETVVHLVERHYEGDLVRHPPGVSRARGHFSFVDPSRPSGLLVGARHQVPLVVGLGEGENFLASNAASLPRETRTVQFPGDGEIVAITPEGATFSTADGEVVQHDTVELDWDDEGAEKGGYETFMLKEIHEQPEAVAETIGDRVRHGRLVLEEAGMSDEELKQLKRIVLVACGTAYHACVVGRYIIEEWARIPVEFDIASEWIYRNPVVDEHTLVIGISQSGETRDTVAAVKLARDLGARTVAITNMMGSQVTREADRSLYTRAGIEMGRRGVEDVHGAGGAALPRRHEAGAGAGTLPPARSSSSSTTSTSCRARSRPSSTAIIRSRRSRSATTTRTSSSTWGATSGCPWRSRARSSSRRSRTSRPRRTRPAR